MKNPIQEAIETQIADNLKNLATKQDLEKAIKKLTTELDELTDKLKDASTPKEMEQHVDRHLEAQLPALINSALLQLLAVPKKKSSGSSNGDTEQLAGDCPRQPHKGKCPSAWCISAQKKAAASADEAAE